MKSVSKIVYLQCIWWEAWPFVEDLKTSEKVELASEAVAARSTARWLQPSPVVETTMLLKPTGLKKNTKTFISIFIV